MIQPIQPSFKSPTLRVLLDRSALDLGAYRSAIEELIMKAYGHRQSIGTAHDRRDRLTLYKLGNLIGRLDLLPDAHVFELGYRCPEQIKSYHASLRRSLPVAYAAGLTRVHLVALDDLHERVWQILNEVTAFYDGLS